MKNLRLSSLTAQQVRDRLAEHKGQWRKIAGITGISYNWIRRFVTSPAMDPSYTYVERLARVIGMKLIWQDVPGFCDFPDESTVVVKGKRPPNRDPNTVDFVTGKTDAELKEELDKDLQESAQGPWSETFGQIGGY